MKKLILSVCLALATSVLALARPASTSPGFSSAQTSIDSTGNLVVSFKEQNLTPLSDVLYSIQSTATVTYGCVSNGSKHVITDPSTVITSSTRWMTMSADSRGKVVGAMSNDYPDAPSSTCTGNSTLTAVRIGYSDILFYDTTNNVTPKLSGVCASSCSTTMK